MRQIPIVLVYLVVLTLADSEADWEKLQTDVWEWNLKTSPEFATSAEVDFYNDQLTSYTLSAYEQKKNDVDEFLERLLEIDPEQLNEKDEISYAILKDRLDTFSKYFKWLHYGPLNSVSIMAGPHVNPSGLITVTPLHNRGDLENYLARLQKLPQQIEESIDNMKKAIDTGHAFHNVSIMSVPGQLDEMITSDPEQFIWYKPFNETLEEMMSIPDEDKTTLRQRARSVVTDVTDALSHLRDFIANDYVPHTRPHISVSTLENGTEFYRDCLKWHTSVDLSPEEIHQMGLDEVARIKGNMEKVIKDLNFNGTVAEFFSSIRSDRQFYLNSSNAFLEEFAHMIDDRISPKMTEYFQNIPRNKVLVKPMEHDGPAGSYMKGAEDGSRPGTFFVNLNSFNFMPTFMLMALTLHETLPGHHLQWSYEIASSLPKSRKYVDSSTSDVPLAFPSYTAYIEGWGLYSEYLGEEMGVYKDENELLGRYGGEMFRACRLVVDTGIHFFNWTREEAVNYILAHTATSARMAGYEVDRYITIPGQACAYKIGELKSRNFAQEQRKN